MTEFARTRTAPRHWWMLMVLAALTVLSLVDRSALSVLIDPVKREFHVSDSHVGLLLGTSFAMLYAVAGLPAGYLVDRFSRRRLLLAGVLFWSGMTVFSSVAATFLLLFVGRMGVGLGEAVLSPVAGSLIRNVIPPAYRARAYAVILAASSTGGGIALLLVGGLGHMVPAEGVVLPLFGHLAPWRLVLMLVGLIGLPVSFLALSFPEPRRPVEAAGEPPATFAFYRHTLVHGRRFYLPMFAAQAIVGIATYGYAAWMPVALARKWEMPASSIAVFFGVVQIIAAVIGLVIGPPLIDALVKRRGSHMTLVVGVTAVLTTATSCILTPLMPTLGLSWAMLFLHWLSVPTSGVAAFTAIAAVTPSATMGKMTATSYLCLSVSGYGLGPALVAAVGEHGFSGPLAVGYGVSLVTGSAAVIASIGYSLACRALRAQCADGEIIADVA